MAKKKKQKNIARILWLVAYVSEGIIVALALILGIIWWNTEGSKSDLEKRGLEDRDLPVMEIELNGVSLEEIDFGDKEIKYKGNKLTIYEEGKAKEYDDVEIKGRGNSTWEQNKKPYQIKFKKPVGLLGLRKTKKWILLANHYDASFLRNDFALMLAEMLDVPYNNRGRFVELYIDGDYRGLYYILQKVEVAKGSVDLRNDDGLLFEIDNLHRNTENCHNTYLKECLVLKGGKVSEPYLNDYIDAFLTDLNKAEKAAEKGDYAVIEEMFDVDSFVKYFLINEFTVNPDAYNSSFYIYRNNEGKIAAGPVWDFDFAMANREWGWRIDEKINSPVESMIRKREAFGYDGFNEDTNISKLLFYLMDMPEFRNKVEKVFQEKMFGRKRELINSILTKAEEIRDAANRDNEKWGKNVFDSEIEMIIEWIKARYDYFENIYGREEKSTGVV